MKNDRKLRRPVTITIALLMVLTFALAGCGGGNGDTPAKGGDNGAAAVSEGADIAKAVLDYSAQTETEIKDDATSSKDELIFAAVADPGKISLDSLFDMTQYPFATACVEYFIRWDFAGNFFYSPVCDSYEVDEDNLGVTFHITPGIKMHDGETFKASDLVASIEAQRKHSGLGWQLDFVDLENSKITDDYTIDIRFNTINGVWESSFSMFTVISGKAYNEMNGDEKFYQAPVSPSPYIVKEWVPGDHITIEAFEDYYRGAPPIKKITMKIVSDGTAAFMELQNGNVDLVWNLSADQVKTIYNGTDDNLELLLTNSNIINYVGMNSFNEALSDFRVREAIYLAVNRDDITLGSFDGLVYPINSIMTSKSIGYNTEFDKTSPFPSPDLEKAKALMKEAGYENGLELRILAESTINFQLVTEQLAAMLEEIGITLKPELTDYATQNAKLHSEDLGGYDLYLSFSQACDESVATLDNPMLFGMSHPELSADGSGEGLQKIWNEIRVTPDIEKRAELYVDAQKYFFEKGLYWLPLNENQSYVGVNKDLTGFRFNGSLIYFEDVYYK
jgi:glutathione transport system substrate-binding protein